MNCPHCASTTTKEQTKQTWLCYRTARCSVCHCTFNERTGTPFNFLQDPTDIVLLVVLWRLRYKLSVRDLAEMFLERGFEFTHEAVRDWEARFAPLCWLLGISVRKKSAHDRSPSSLSWPSLNQRGGVKTVSFLIVERISKGASTRASPNREAKSLTGLAGERNRRG